MAQFCSVHIHAKNNEKDLFITVHHGFHHFHYLVNVLNRFSSYFIMVFIYIYSCSLFCHCLLFVFLHFPYYVKVFLQSFLFFQVCFMFLHFPYYVNEKSRCLLLHLILFVFVIKTIYIYIIDKIKNLQKHMEIPRNSSWIRSKTWKNTWKIQEPHHG